MGEMTASVVGLMYCMKLAALVKKDPTTCAQKREAIMGTVLLPGRTRSITVQDLLHGCVCMSNNTWNPERFAQLSRQKHNIKAIRSLLSTETHYINEHAVFSHNDLIWHLASNKYFVLFGETCLSTLRNIVGDKNIKWTCDTNNIPLGARGLGMTESQAMRLMDAAKPWLMDIQNSVATTGTRVEHESPPVYAAYGWFFDISRIWTRTNMNTFIVIESATCIRVQLSTTTS